MRTGEHGVGSTGARSRTPRWNFLCRGGERLTVSWSRAARGLAPILLLEIAMTRPSHGLRCTDRSLSTRRSAPSSRGRRRPSLAAMAGGVAATVSNIIDGILVTMRRLGTWLFRLGVGVFAQVFRFLQCHGRRGCGPAHAANCHADRGATSPPRRRGHGGPPVDPRYGDRRVLRRYSRRIRSPAIAPVRVDSPAEGAAPIAAACVQDDRPAATSRSTVPGSGAGGVDAAGHMATVTAIERIERLAADASRQLMEHPEQPRGPPLGRTRSRRH